MKSGRMRTRLVDGRYGKVVHVLIQAQHHEDVSGRGGKAPCVLNLVTRSAQWSASRFSRLIPDERALGITC